MPKPLIYDANGNLLLPRKELFLLISRYFCGLMAQKKLQRFEAIKSFPNVFQYPRDIAGKWHEFFGNGNPITLELACGKGEYTIALAKMHPERNFIGVDL